MSIFGALHVQIRQRLPKEAQRGCEAIERFARQAILGYGEYQTTLAINYVVGVWAANQVERGLVIVTKNDHLFMVRGAEVATRTMNEETRRSADACVEKLVEQGQILKLEE